MSARYIVCSLCEGNKVDSEGQRCVECQGLGGSTYGEDRTLRELDDEVLATERILRLDLLELDRASGKLGTCKPEHRAQCHKHVETVKSSVVYWEFRLGLLRREIARATAAAV